MDLPDQIAALGRILSTAQIAHESIFDLHRELFAVLPEDHRGRELLAEAAAIVVNELPQLTAAAKRLQRRWWDELVLDPPSADQTVVELEAELERIGRRITEIFTRQREIAREMRSILDEAR